MFNNIIRFFITILIRLFSLAFLEHWKNNLDVHLNQLITLSVVMSIAQEWRSCENVSLECRAFCVATIFLCVSGEWRRIEDPFIRVLRHDRLTFPDTRNFVLSMSPYECRSLRSWKDRYLFASLYVLCM